MKVVLPTRIMNLDALPPLDGFQIEHSLVVLHGQTGVGKTAVLRALARRGARVLDLEALANHRGSAFGGFGLPEQPEHRRFRDELEHRWRGFDQEQVVFVEQCGRYLGSVGLPPELLGRLVEAPWIQLESSVDDRLDRLIDIYGAISSQNLLKALRRLRPRLTATVEEEARQAILRQDMHAFLRLLLPYYDRAYAHQVAQLKGACLAVFEVERCFEDAAAAAILAYMNQAADDAVGRERK